jgi:competence protein ComEC
LLFLAGGLAAQHTTLLPSSDLLHLVLVASLCGLFRARMRSAAMFSAGLALFMIAGQHIVAERLDASYSGDSMLTRVRVTDYPKVSGDSVYIVVEPVDDHRLPRRSRVSWYQPQVAPDLGEIWELELRLRRPRGSFNPGVFDYETWLFREKFHATGYVVPGKRNRLLWAAATTRLDRFRERFNARAKMAAADSGNAAAVLAAIGTGSRQWLSREQWNRYALSGTSHLMAISGLHVGLAASAAFFCIFPVLGLLRRRGNSFLTASVLGVSCALLYAVVSGFGIPARRAIIMLAVATLALVRRRQIDPFTIAALSAVTIYLADPVAVLHPGFTLSFAAVFMLLWLAKRRSSLHRRTWLVRVPAQLVIMQIFLFFGLLPLTAVIFQRVATMAIPINLVAVPLFGLVTVPLTLAGLAVGDISATSAKFMLRIAAQSIDGLELIISRAIDLPFADTTLSEVAGTAWLFVFVPLLWVFLPRGWPGRWIAILGVAAIVSWKPAPPPHSCFDARILDVGQGLAATVRTSQDVLLYDTGMAWRGGGSAAEQVLLPFFSARGIGRVDQMVVSHADLDHSGGAAIIREKLHLGDVYFGEAIPGMRGRPCEAGQQWRSAGILIEVLHPQRSSRALGNDASCVLRVSAGDHALLLTGDIEADGERILLQSGADLAADIAVVPHHGSATSSGVSFVDSIHPDYAVVSAGHANRWGLPKAAVTRRWQAIGARVLNTATSGAIHFRVCAAGGIVRVSEERERRRRFWHAAT